MFYCLACQVKRADPAPGPRPCIGCGSTENKATGHHYCRTCLAERDREREAKKERRGRRDVLLPHEPGSVYAALTMEQRADVKRLMDADRRDRSVFESSFH